MNLDTPRLTRKLRESGLEERQAEGLIEVLKTLDLGRDAAPHRDADLIRQEIRDLEFRIDARLQTVQNQLMLIKMLLGLIAGGILVLVARVYL